MKRIVSIALGILLACSLIGCAPKSVLLVTQYPDGSPRVAEATAAIKARLGGENERYGLRVFNADLTARDSDIWRETMSRRAVAQIHAYNPDFVFVMGDDAARYFAQTAVELHRKFIFFDVAGDPAMYGLTDPNKVTGITEKEPVQELFAYMKQAVPAARGAAVIADNSLLGNAVVAQIEQAGNLPIRVVQIKRARTMAEWMAAVQDAQDKADVLVIASYMEVRKSDTDSATVPAAELLLATSQANALPDFSFWKEAVGANGVMAAVTAPVGDQARMAARVAAMVLTYDEDLKDYPIEPCKERTTVTSADRAMKLHIKLPEAGAMGSQAMPRMKPAPAAPIPAPTEPVVVPK